MIVIELPNPGALLILTVTINVSGAFETARSPKLGNYLWGGAVSCLKFGLFRLLACAALEMVKLADLSFSRDLDL